MEFDANGRWVSPAQKKQPVRRAPAQPPEPAPVTAAAAPTCDRCKGPYKGSLEPSQMRCCARCRKQFEQVKGLSYGTLSFVEFRRRAKLPSLRSARALELEQFAPPRERVR